MVYTTLKKKEIGWEASTLAYMSLKHGSYVAKIIIVSRELEMTHLLLTS